jgi:hypothetical protein
VANHLAIQALSSSLKDFLQHSYEAAMEGATLPPCAFEVLSSAKFAGTSSFDATTATVYLYRVTTNHHLRNLRTGTPAGPLGLDLHFLLTVWGADTDTAEIEQTVLGWLVRELHYHPYLDSSLLSAGALWAADETVALLPADLSMEELVRIWDAVNRPFRLSYGFLARFVRLAKPEAEFAPVVATRLSFTDDPLERAP